MKKKIAIIFPANSMNRIYSVAGVLIDQVNMLVENGYQVTLLVPEQFSETEASSGKFEIKKVFAYIPPQKRWQEEETFYQLSGRILDILKQTVPQYDICITHGLLLLPAYLPYHYAIRKYASEHSKPFWLHWIHSNPALLHLDIQDPYQQKQAVFTPVQEKVFSLPFKNAKAIYLNQSDKQAIADYFCISPEDVLCIYNSIAFEKYYELTDEAMHILEHVSLFEKDIVIVYPTRTTIAKQFDKIIHICAFLNQKGLRTSVIFCNSYANSDRGQVLVEYLKKIVQGLGLTEKEVLFTSELGYSNGVRQKTVKDLFLLANTFILPSVSEAAPLVLLEASLGYNLLILNDQLPSLKEFAGPNALYVNFEDSPIAWLSRTYEWILQQRRENVLFRQKEKIIKQFNPKHIFQEGLAPLLNQLP